MNRRDLDQRLRREAAAPTPAPGVRFSQDLAERLRDGVGAPGPRVDPLLRAPRGWRPPLVGVAAFTALALATVALVRDGQSSDRESVRLTQAADASVRLPGGAVVAARPGLTVPDGGVVETGAAGRVVADDVEVGPNRRAVVNDGKLAMGASAGTGQEDMALASRPPSPKPDGAESRRTSPSSTSPSADGGAAAGSPAASTSVETLDAKAVWRGDGVALAWSRHDGADFDAYLVLRAADPAEPAYPPDENTVVITKTSDRQATAFGDRQPGLEPRYRVVAVARDGRLLAQSRVLTPERATTTTTRPSTDPLL